MTTNIYHSTVIDNQEFVKLTYKYYFIFFFSTIANIKRLMTGSKRKISFVETLITLPLNDKQLVMLFSQFN